MPVHRSTAQEHRLGLADTDKHYLIAETAEGARLAYVILAGLDSTSAEAEIELMRMAVARPGGGLGQPILRQIIDLAFGKFGANRLWLMDGFTATDKQVMTGVPAVWQIQ